MDKECGNIDLIFRNGLKDFEVLPPEEVWTNISPVIHVPGYYTFFRSAAIIASVVSIGFLAYFIGKNASPKAGDPLTSFSIAQGEPIHFSYSALISTPKVNQPGKLFDKSESKVNYPEINVIPANQFKVGKVENNELAEAIMDDEKQFNAESALTTNPLYQDLTVKKDVISKRWSISALASPTYYSEIGSVKDDLSKHLAASETPISSYTGGFAISYRISRRISVQTGFFYASQGQRIEGINSYAGYQSYSQSKGSSFFGIRTSSGTVVSENADIFLSANAGERIISNTSIELDPSKANLNFLGNEIIQNFNYLQMPIILRYKVIDRNLDVNVIGGLSYDLLIKNNAYAWVNGSKFFVGETTGLNTMTLSSTFGMGMEYGISDKISLNLEPTFRYFLNPYSRPVDPNLHHYSFGIFSGFSYRF